MNAAGFFAREAQRHYHGHMRRVVSGLAAVCGVIGVATTAIGACNVKIDASVLDDAGTADAFAPSVVGCHSSADCTTKSPCVTGRCDEAALKCVFEVCPTGDQCSATSCTTTNVCGRSKTFGFHAGSFRIPEGLACPTCVGAMFPWVFVATNLQLRAFRVSDPNDSAPPEVPVSPLGFSPRAVVTSGRRVYFIGGPAGASFAPYQLQVAWIETPADPGVQYIRAHTKSVPYPSPDFRFDGVVVGSGDLLFPLRRVQTYENNLAVLRDQELQVHVDAGQDPGQLDFIAPTNYPANGHTIGFSNNRLAVYRNNAGVGTFSFDLQPGTTGASNTGDQPLPDMGTPGASTFAQTADGAIYWQTAIRKPLVPNEPQHISGVRLALALDGGSTFSAASRADVELYADPGQPENGGLPIPNPYVGPVAPMGNGAALVLAAARENPSQTSVQLVTRSGGTMQLAPGKRFLLAGRADQIAAAGTDGFGYVVNPDTSETMTVHIFSASCP